MSNSRTILITGGAGFIGSRLAEKLIDDPANYVVIADDLSTGSIKKLPSPSLKNWHFIRCDVNEYQDISEIMLGTSFDYVFHYAAMVGVKRTQENPHKVLHDLDGIKHICNLSKNTRVKRLFFASSSEVYGEPVHLPQNEETTPLNSRLPYAVVKNVGEAFLRTYKKEFGLDFSIFRFFNTYGSKQSIDFVMSKFIRHALRNEDIPLFGGGKQTRTFCFIDDNVDACISALYNNHVVNEVVNIGSDYELSIRDLAELIIDITGSDSKLIILPPLAEGDMQRRLPDITKMQKLLNRPMKPIREGIYQILNNPEFIMNGHDHEFATRYESCGSV
ncbi:MAG TPA: NAD-dependent epimerase/dehydratase family protein [Bacteroidales bacterium]|nr:NAD-dependent epimerase/dehydratase family protein [Bacteroidales bacterium]